MFKQVIAVAAVVVAACAPYTFFPDNADWYKLNVAGANEGHGHGGDGGHGGGGNGGNGGNGGEGGHGGNGGGGSTGGGSVSAPSVSYSGSGSNGSALVTTGGQGVSAASLEALQAAVKACEMTRPGLAIGDVKGNGNWSFITFDDTVWPYIQRCMKVHGYPAYGTDFTEQSNFGTR